MASINAILSVKTNTQEVDYPSFTDSEIGRMLDDANGSINFVSYKICMLKSSDNAITLGPISLSSDKDYWNNLSKFYYELWQNDKLEAQEKESVGGTRYMIRADEEW